MSTIEVHRCDRCGRFCDDEQYITLTLDSGENAHESDLCDACEADLDLFLDGRKLARLRKAAQS